MVVMAGEVLLVDEEVVVFVQFPELAVDDVEVLVGEVVSDLIDVVLLLQQGQGLQEVAAAQLHHGDATRPRTVHHVEYPLDHLECQEMVLIGMSEFILHKGERESQVKFNKTAPQKHTINKITQQ